MASLIDVLRGGRAGAFRPIDAFQGAITLWAGVHGVTSLLISKSDFPWPPLDELTEGMCAVLLEGLLSDKARKKSRR